MTEDKETALAVIEDLRERFRDEGMTGEQEMMNEAHVLIQEYHDHI